MSENKTRGDAAGSSFVELTWSEEEISGEILRRFAVDGDGNVRIEERIQKDGAKEIWRNDAQGLPQFFRQISAAGKLELERIFDQTGQERDAVGYFENGQMAFRTVIDKTGTVTLRSTWSQAGLLLEESRTVNNLKDGTTSIYSSLTGRLLSRIDYKNDRPHGPSEIYDDQRPRPILRSRQEYVHGEVDGSYSIYFASGRLEESGNKRNGKRHGEVKWFYPSGKIQRLQHYLDGVLEGDSEEYFENGCLRRRFSLREGKLHGIEENYNEKGQITLKTAYLAGEAQPDLSAFEKNLNGEVKTYYDNGNLRALTTYHAGVKSGPFQTFDPGGRLRQSGHYKANQLEGKVDFFFANGKLECSTQYADGIKDGEQKFYFESGILKSFELFKSDFATSLETYFENGILHQQSQLDEYGFGVNRWYNDRGLLLLETQVRSFGLVKQGIERAYAEDGVLSSESLYQSGQLNGVQKIFWPNGQLRYENQFLQGSLVALSSYNQTGQLIRTALYKPDGSLSSEEYFSVEDHVQIGADKVKLEKGSQIGNYEIQRAIGHGGMGDVYLAHERGLDRRVAIKTIRGEADAEAVSRFYAEGNALAKIRHDHVITIYSVGNHFGMPYMVMEYVEGWSLNALLGQGMLGLTEQIFIFKQMVEGIQAAHRATVLHRDLKPGNIIVSKNFEVKVIDFGVSKILGDVQSHRTAANVVVGTIKYLAPEIAVGLPATPQTDIYGLGIVLFEMLTGAAPFLGDNKFETIELIKTKELQFPSGISDILPDALKDLVKRMTMKAVGERYANLDDVLKDLEKISFDHLPPQFTAPTPRGLEIVNADEVKKILLEKGHSESEFSLILNLASRIQHRMVAQAEDQEKTLSLIPQVDLIISPEALSEATDRYERAKRDYLESKSKK